MCSLSALKILETVGIINNVSELYKEGDKNQTEEYKFKFQSKKKTLETSTFQEGVSQDRIKG